MNLKTGQITFRNSTVFSNGVYTIDLTVELVDCDDRLMTTLGVEQAVVAAFPLVRKCDKDVVRVTVSNLWDELSILAAEKKFFDVARVIANLKAYKLHYAGIPPRGDMSAQEWLFFVEGLAGISLGFRYTGTEVPF